MRVLQCDRTALGLRLALVDVAAVLLLLVLLARDPSLLILLRDALAVESLLAIALLVLLAMDAVTNLVGTCISLTCLALLCVALCIALRGGDACVACIEFTTPCILRARPAGSPGLRRTLLCRARLVGLACCLHIALPARDLATLGRRPLRILRCALACRLFACDALTLLHIALADGIAGFGLRLALLRHLTAVRLRGSGLLILVQPMHVLLVLLGARRCLFTEAGSKRGADQQ